MSSLETELFNLKLKLHHYEKKLESVQLHGLTGERLSQQNEELKSALLKLQEEKEDILSQNVILKETCVKSRDGLINFSEQLSTLTAQHIQKDQVILETTEKYNEVLKKQAELVEKLSDFEKTKSLLVFTQESLNTLKTTCSALTHELKVKTEESEQLLAVVKAKDLLEEELKASKSSETLLRREVLDLKKAVEEVKSSSESKVVEMSLKMKLQLTQETEKVVQEAERKCRTLERRIEELNEEVKLERNSSLQSCCEVERFRIRNEELSRQLKESREEAISLNVANKNYNLTKAGEIRTLSLDWERKAKEQEDRHQEVYKNLQKANTQHLFEQRVEREKLIGEMNLLKNKHEEELQMKEREIVKLKETVAKLKEKWEHSITCKREEKLTSAGRSCSQEPTKRGSSANLLSTDFCSEKYFMRETNSVITSSTTRQSLPDENNSQTGNVERMGRSRPNSAKKTIPVKSRFLNSISKK